MKDETIQSLINQLNNSSGHASIYTREISNNVDLAKVWLEEPKIDDNIIGNFDSYTFYFIKNETKNYVGAVLDMYQDLHWYIAPKQRKLGHLTKSLFESILPYIFYERDSQRITISSDLIGESNYTNSKSVAIKLGFNPTNINETEFELGKEDFNWEFEKLEEKNKQYNNEVYENLKKRAFYAYKLLHKISDELMMNVNDDRGLYEVANEVKKFTWKIEDIEWENGKTRELD